MAAVGLVALSWLVSMVEESSSGAAERPLLLLLRTAAASALGCAAMAQAAAVAVVADCDDGAVLGLNQSVGGVRHIVGKKGLRSSGSVHSLRTRLGKRHTPSRVTRVSRLKLSTSSGSSRQCFKAQQRRCQMVVGVASDRARRWWTRFGTAPMLVLLDSAEAVKGAAEGGSRGWRASRSSMRQRHGMSSGGTARRRKGTCGERSGGKRWAVAMRLGGGERGCCLERRCGHIGDQRGETAKDERVITEPLLERDLRI